MKSLLNLSLIASVTLLAVHEMDAMTHAEWRLLPVLNDLQDENARDAFVLLRIPLYVGLFWSLFFATWKQLAGRIFSVALIAHAIVHYLLSGHELYTFVAPIETVTVYGAAMFSICYLAISLKGTPE